MKNTIRRLRQTVAAMRQSICINDEPTPEAIGAEILTLHRAEAAGLPIPKTKFVTLADMEQARKDVEQYRRERGFGPEPVPFCERASDEIHSS